MINLMTMDYGSAVAPDGANSMGKYAISAAKSTYQQAVNVGLTNIKIGITPMIGKNDVAGEVFTLANAREVIEFANAQTWIGWIGMWSINRDVDNINGALFASSQIAQKQYDFTNIFKTVTTGGSVVKPDPINLPSVPPVTNPSAPPVGGDPSGCGPTNGGRSCINGNCCSQFGYCGASAGHCGTGCQSSFGRCDAAGDPNTPAPPVTPPVTLPPPLTGAPSGKMFAPYCDILLWPTFDVSIVSEKVGVKMFTLGFVVADHSGNPAWGSVVPLADKFYSTQLTKLRNLGGDAIVSFGGAIGKETLFNF